MNAQDLIARFSEIPPVMHGEAVLQELAETFGEFLQSAFKPSSCSAHQMTADHHVYMKLIAPMEVLKFGFIAPEKTIATLREHIAAFESDRDAFLAEMIPPDAAATPHDCMGDH